MLHETLVALKHEMLVTMILCVMYVGIICGEEPRAQRPSHQCKHDGLATQRLFYHHGKDTIVPVKYNRMQGRGFHELSVNNLRVVLSLRDVFDSTKVCTAVGQTISDFEGGTVQCSSTQDILTPAKREILLNQVLPTAMAMHSSRLRVNPATSNIVVESGACPYFNIATQDTTTGFANADLVMYVAAAKTSGSAIAWAGACQLDQNMRTTVGRVNFNPYYIDNTSATQLDWITRVGAHEILHVLGFANDIWYNYFPDVISTATVRGKVVDAINSTGAVGAARNYFGCSTLQWVELEDEGGDGTSGSHWERRNHYEDLMSGWAGDKMWYTNWTLGLLGDMGVYYPDYSKAETPLYAKGLGCGFLSQKCLGDSNPAQSTLFCNDTSQSMDYCTYDNLASGYCSTTTYTTSLPMYFQYFSNTFQGGYDDGVDYCPNVRPYSNRYCNDSTSEVSSITYGTYYGGGGRCFVTSNLVQSSRSSSLDTTSCLRSRCLNGKRIQLKIGNTDWINCPADGSAATLTAPSGYRGTIQCPRVAAFCTADLFEPCPYICPDDTCANDLFNCSCTTLLRIRNVTAVLGGVAADGSADPRVRITAAASASYRIEGNSSCSSFSFGPLLRYSWSVALANGTVVATARAATLTIAANSLLPNATYVLAVNVSGIRGEWSARQWNVSVSTPAPYVSITDVLGTLVRISTAATLAIPTTIVEVAMSAATFSWTCAPAAQCPTLANATVRGATVVAGSAAVAGTYVVTFTYRGQYSSSLTLVLLDGSVPVVRILAASSSVAPASMPLYLHGDRVFFGVAVTSFSGAVNVSWSVRSSNGSVVLASSAASSLAVNTSLLDATNLTAAAQAQLVANVIAVRVASAANASVFGEAQLQVAVLERVPLSVAVVNAGDGGAAVVAVSDYVRLTPATTNAAVATLPAWLSAQYAFGYMNGATRVPLRATPAASGSGFTVLAPVPQSGGNATLVFYAVLRLNGFDVANATGSLLVTVPDAAAAAQAQLQQAAAVTDADSALALAGNMRALMNASGSGGAGVNATQSAELAVAVASMLVKSVANVSTLSADQQGVLFNTLASAVAAGGAANKADLQNATRTFLSGALSGGSFDPTNGDAALSAIGTLAAADAGGLATQLATAMANDPDLEIGTPRVMSVSGIVIVTVKQTASSISGGLQLSAGGSNGTALTVPSGVDLGVDANSIVGGSSTTFTANPFGNDSASGQQPTAAVFAFSFSVDGVDIFVSNLTQALVITMPVSSGVCKFWNATSLQWSTAGVASVVVGGVVTCQTTHLTSFTTFASSGTTSAPSAPASSSSTSAIIGGVIGGVVGTVLLVLIVFFCTHRKSKKSAEFQKHNERHQPVRPSFGGSSV